VYNQFPYTGSAVRIQGQECRSGSEGALAPEKPDMSDGGNISTGATETLGMSLTKTLSFFTFVITPVRFIHSILKVALYRAMWIIERIHCQTMFDRIVMYVI